MFWPFANPWMLLWGLAVLAPIALHLWSRRRVAEHAWAAMDFLLAALRQSAARLRMEQWLLLALRILVLLLLAIALAEPILAPRAGAAGGGVAGERMHTILVLDRSYSMSYVHGGRPRFAAAKQAALNQVAAAMRGDAITIVAMGDPPLLVTPQPVLERRALAKEISALEPAQQSADLAQTLALVDRAVDEANRAAASPLHVQVCFFSDMDRAAWADVAQGGASSAAGRLLESIAGKAALHYVDVGRGDSTNVAVVRLEALPSLSTVGESIDVDAEVRGFGAATWRRELELFVDGELVAARSVSAADGESAVERFTHRFTAPGPHVVEARLNDDALKIDDRRWLALDVRQTLRVLCVEGKPGAARYASAALRSLSARGVRVQADTAADSAIIHRDLTIYDCVVLCNVARFARQDALALDSFTRGGGGLIVFLGDQSQADSYNTELADPVTGRELLPARIVKLADGGEYRFDPLNYRHSILAPFRGRPRAGLLSTAVRRYYKLAPREEASPDVALAFAGGDPAIVAAQVGQGYCLLVATAASDQSIDRTVQPPRTWSDYYREPLFPPLLERMIAFAARQEARALNVRVGEPLTGLSDDAVAIAPPGDAPNPHAMTIEVDPASHLWSYQATDFSGVYTVRGGESEPIRTLAAVNVDPRESSLERIDAPALPGELMPLDVGAATAAPTLSPRPARPLHAAMLTAVLVLLAAEAGLAWRFGSAAA